jgi:hypothetical protein
MWTQRDKFYCSPAAQSSIFAPGRVNHLTSLYCNAGGMATTATICPIQASEMVTELSQYRSPRPSHSPHVNRPLLAEPTLLRHHEGAAVELRRGRTI